MNEWMSIDDDNKQQQQQTYKERKQIYFKKIDDIHNYSIVVMEKMFFFLCVDVVKLLHLNIYNISFSCSNIVDEMMKTKFKFK